MIQSYLEMLKKTWKLVVLGLFITMVVIIFSLNKEVKFQKSENKRQTENLKQIRTSDSLKFSKQILSKEELLEELNYRDSELLKKLKQDNIKPSKIESIITNNYTYKDTITVEQDVSKLVEAIKSSVPKTQAWLDSSKCQTIKGEVLFDGEKLKVIIKEKSSKNKSDAIAYLQNNEWRFLFWKTRFLGKKGVVYKVYNDCGESTTKILEVKKK